MKIAFAFAAIGAALITSPAYAKEPTVIQLPILYVGAQSPDWDLIDTASNACRNGARAIRATGQQWETFYLCLGSYLQNGYRIIYPENGNFPAVSSLQSRRTKLVQPGIVYSGSGDSRGERYRQVTRNCRTNTQDVTDPGQNVSLYYNCLQTSLEPTYQFVDPLN